MEDLSCNIKCELKQIKSSQGFDMKVVESTDIDSNSLLLAFVRYVLYNQVQEKMLMYKHLHTQRYYRKRYFQSLLTVKSYHE